MESRISRRCFLAGMAAGWGLSVLSHTRQALGYAANEKVRVALVGVGGRGTWFVDQMPRLAQVVALCDVDRRKIEQALRHWEESGKKLAGSSQAWERRVGEAMQRLASHPPKVFRDFRAMLAEMGSQVDAVVVATPDHTHAVASAAAIRAGKGVFCEKPLSRTVHESRVLCELARQYRVATAMGNQGTYSGPFRRALELIRLGRIGQVKEVYVWNDAGGADRKEPPQGQQPVPEYLDWDLWLGPARARPFHPQWMQRHLWREFGTCQLGNWASHTANLAFMALKVHELWRGASKGPAPRIRVEAETSGINRLSFPRWEVVRWHIPARAEFGPITIVWHNGSTPGMAELLDRAVRDAPEKQKGLWRFAGTLIVGTEGSIHTTGHNMWFRLLPEEKFRDIQRERPETVESSRGPESDWLEACRGGKPAWSNFEYASALNEFLMLGNVATQFDVPLEYDPVAMKIVNHAEADACLRSEYRQGWAL